MTGSMDDGRSVDVVYLGFSKVFDVFSHSSLIVKLGKYRQEKQTVNMV